MLRIFLTVALQEAVPPYPRGIQSSAIDPLGGYLLTEISMLCCPYQNKVHPNEGSCIHNQNVDEVSFIIGRLGIKQQNPEPPNLQKPGLGADQYTILTYYGARSLSVQFSLEVQVFGREHLYYIT